MAKVQVGRWGILLIIAPSASSAFARANDPARDVRERRRDFATVGVKLAAVRELLEKCDREAAAAVGLHPEPGQRSSPEAGPRLVHTRPSSAAGLGRCQDRTSTVGVADGGNGREFLLCLPHTTSAVRMVSQLSVVIASRTSRAVLAEAAARSCVIKRRVRGQADVTKAAR